MTTSLGELSLGNVYKLCILFRFKEKKANFKSIVNLILASCKLQEPIIYYKKNKIRTINFSQQTDRQVFLLRKLILNVVILHLLTSPFINYAVQPHL